MTNNQQQHAIENTVMTQDMLDTAFAQAQDTLMSVQQLDTFLGMQDMFATEEAFQIVMDQRDMDLSVDTAQDLMATQDGAPSFMDSLGETLNAIEPTSGEIIESAALEEEDEDDEAGFGFRSEFTADMFGPLYSAGPIDVTELLYGGRMSSPQSNALAPFSTFLNSVFQQVDQASFEPEDAPTQTITPTPQSLLAQTPTPTTPPEEAAETPDTTDVIDPPAPLAQDSAAVYGDVQISARISNETTAQTIINSVDHYDLPWESYDQSYRIYGDEMDISGVGQDAWVNYNYKDETTFSAALKSEWNSVKNIEVEADGAADITVKNFVHADVVLGDGGDSSVDIRGAKRGDIQTGDGDDSIYIVAQTNGAGWSNIFDIDSGAGSDHIVVKGDAGHTAAYIDAGAGDDVVRVVSDYAYAAVDLSAGDDFYKGRDGVDNIVGGTGDDTVRTNKGDDFIYGDTLELATATFSATQMQVGWVASNAGFKNTVGFYTVLEDGTIDDVQLAYDNMKGSNTDDRFFNFDGVEAQQIQAFIIANGYNLNQSYQDFDLESGAFDFVYDYGGSDVRAARITDDAMDVTLVFTDESGMVEVSGRVYHQNADLNADGQDHVIESVSEDGGLNIGFEDLWNLGDQDFRDAVVEIQTEALYTLDYSDVLGGDDSLYAGAGDDVLVGGGGDDLLYGGDDIDVAVAVYMGQLGEYTITKLGASRYEIADTVDGRDGTDIIRDIEGILFGVEDVYVDILSHTSTEELQAEFGVDSAAALDLSMVVENFDPVSAAIDAFVSGGGAVDNDVYGGDTSPVWALITPQDALVVQEGDNAIL